MSFKSRSRMATLAAAAAMAVTSAVAWAQDQPAPPTTASTAAATASPAPTLPAFIPNPVLVWVIIVLVLACVLLAFVWLRNAMIKSPWSLADALSEETDVAYFTPTGPKLDNTGKPVTVSEMRASSSRLIALLGAIVILFFFVGFGGFVLYQYGTTGAMPPVGDILKFLSGGLALFAPYAVNKLSKLGTG